MLYSATSRFAVTYTSSGTVNPDGLFDGAYDGQPCIIPVGTTAVFSIDFTGKQGTALSYPRGKVQLHFYSGGVPASVSGRMMKSDGTWYDITGWINVSTVVNNAVWEGTTSGVYTGAQILEITVQAPAGGNASLTEIEYIQNRPLALNGLVTKFNNQILYKNFEWRDVNNTQVAFIRNDGNASFKGIGVNTLNPTVALQVTGNSIISGHTTLGSLTIATNAVAGRVFTCNASGLGTWQDLPAGSGSGWTLTGNSGTTENKLGTTGAVDLPFITNNTEKMRITKDGNVGIGITSFDANYKLHVNGNIRARKVRVENNNWPDYVFKTDYPLMSLAELAAFIKQYHHLPEIPSATEVQKSGIDLGANQATLLKKIEELTLYIIEQQSKLDQQQDAIKQQNQRIEQLEKKLNSSPQ
ncbi:hypothetical protein [Pseudoflavitalea rhizosphaerae]|uniref:hypothetical protein n=1 Tax=Pseudoflavitalea rhizosphaerae TaxID=1884793 RepID=UPI000F8D4985|nr:hypothetical protein [Pseudoflavitalea rhizosphaerae]